MNDDVRHPDHYCWIPGHECKDIVAWFDFHRGSAMKYLWRSGRKAGVSEEKDLLKAMEAIRNRLAFIRSESYDDLEALEELSR